MLKRRREIRKAMRLARALVALDEAARQERPAPQRKALHASLSAR